VRAEMAMRAPPAHRSFLVASVQSCPTFWYSTMKGARKEPYPREETDRGDYKSFFCL
jgi:hypothetical protein